MGEEHFPKERLIEKLESEFPGRFARDKTTLRLYSRDYWPLALLKETRGEELPLPLGVVWPESVEEVSRIIKLCNDYRIPFVPYAGGSGVIGGTICKDCVVIDVKRMNKVISFSEEDAIVVVESGILLKKLEDFLNSRGFTLRHIPQSFPEAAIGGLIATMSTGQFSTKYGGIEELVLDLEVVTPDGSIIPLRKNTVPRAATGPNLKYLLIGSEGQLGVITKAVLRVFRLPKNQWKNSYAFPDFESGLKAMRELMLSGLTPAVARLYDRDDASLRFHHDRDILLLIFEEDNERLLSVKTEESEKIIKNYGGVAIGPEPVEKWLATRFDVISELKKLVVPLNLWFDTIETAATWSALPRVYRVFKERVKKVKGVYAVLAHASHFYTTGACIYFTLTYEANEETYWRMWEEAMKTLLETGATISHHHGIGLLRKKWVRDELGDTLEYLKRIKRCLDPNNVSNPGKWLGE
ncbi:FAD-binding oxidoreductase [Infirmifilum uzonense]|jgi:alkyldihydroxyacetonephosphate synthase|uniref:FAD-binding oxidoreductase n=1 Tax=Infirmifilum uzonense TaxID=1550241 RepID=UPI003C725BF5